jgi:deoxyribodipyrimidine photolyase-related protein
VFGDQLDSGSAAFDDFDKGEDAVLMMEVKEEATYIPQHKIRLAFFFSAMRHFAGDLKDRGYTLYYVALDDPNNRGSFEAEITRWFHKTRPQRIICVWNFDKDNRGVFGNEGPPKIKPPRSFQPDRTTKDVIKLVQRRFSDSPGRLKNFDYPVTHEQALEALRDFVKYRMEYFGTYQDAMATDHPYLYHSRLSCVLNLHLLDPRKVIDGAISAYRDGSAPINSVEGFVRQVLGWREFVRGVYWLKMPEYAGMNALRADLPMPAFMWTAETEMNCIHMCIRQLIDHAYAHHIQRLMVMGLFALLLGVRPYEVHQWHLSMYADAVDWVSLPNVLGMSQYGDGGIIGTKPYAASGSYIDKMSDYCVDCIYDPKDSIRENACPFTTLYWDFLSRNRKRLKKNPRMGLQFRNLDRKSDADRKKIRKKAKRLKSDLTRKTYI